MQRGRAPSRGFAPSAPCITVCDSQDRERPKRAEMNLFAGKSGDADVDKGLVGTAREGEGRMNRESSPDLYTLRV